MANRLASAILLAFGISTLLAACDDGDDRIDGMDGGEAGEAGTKTGGSSSGGSSAGKGGTQPVGGKTQGGAAGEAGMAGEGGEPTFGGAPLGGGGGEGGTDGGAAGMGGAGGAGGAESPPVVYACGSSTINRRLCSAFIAAECETLPACVGDPPPDPCCTDCMTYTCPDCVATFDSERPTFAECPACLAEYERNLLCAIEPFEAGNLSEGVMCFDGYGAERSVDCDPIFLSALNCLDYLVENDCPASWPIE